MANRQAYPASDPELAERQRQRRSLLCVLVLIPPICLVIAAAITLLTSPFVGETTADNDQPSWLYPIFRFVLGAGTLWVGIFSLRHTLHVTRGDFEVFWLQTVFGILVMTVGSAALLLQVVLLLTAGTSVFAEEGTGSTSVALIDVIVITLFGTAFQIGWTWIGAYLYSHAFTNQRPSRISLRRADEVDGIGELLGERE